MKRGDLELRDVWSNRCKVLVKEVLDPFVLAYQLKQTIDHSHSAFTVRGVFHDADSWTITRHAFDRSKKTFPDPLAGEIVNIQ